MANAPKRVYWDSCSWIALITRERIPANDGQPAEDRGAMCRSVINAAFSGQIEIAICSITCAEVHKDPKLENPKTAQIVDFFGHDFILLVNLDHEVSLLARDLLSAGHSKLKPIDACHIAAAALCRAEEMHTFDDKILALDGLIVKPDGTKLKICTPGEGGPPVPLLQLAAST